MGARLWRAGGVTSSSSAVIFSPHRKLQDASLSLEQSGTHRQISQMPQRRGVLRAQSRIGSREENWTLVSCESEETKKRFNIKNGPTATQDIWFIRNKLPCPLVDLRVSGTKHFSHLSRFMLSWSCPRFQEPESDPSTGKSTGSDVGLNAPLSSQSQCR